MVEYHNKAFFGSKTGMFFDSSSWTNQFFFLKFIKKRKDGTWEKPSLKEGKSIKFSLEEMVYILRVLSKEKTSWKTFHKFEDNQTDISFQWDKEDEERFHVNGGEYHKMLNYAEIFVFRALLEHVFEEKIARSTVNSKNIGLKKPVDAVSYSQKPELTITEEIKGQQEQKSQIPKHRSFPQVEKVNLDNETVTVEGICEGNTEKALLILFESGKEIWIPKSTIRSEFDQESSNTQQFTIDTWVLKKNAVFV